LPAQSTSFIGRETELAVIDQYLANPTCRLVTIVGLGGIGKTRLALQAAAAIKKFEHGVCFIRLTFTSSDEFLISTMSDTLNFPFYGRVDPKTQLLNYLSDKEMLLVMDNFEHLLTGASLLVEILQRAPGIKMLVTSRERLGLQAEWVLNLEGLPYPSNNQGSNIENYSAVQLFLHRARQVQASFWLTYRDKPAVARICRLVEGLPLGIELAAAWTRTLSCEDIATEIEKSYNFLATSLQNIPRRHRSLRAVCEHSWGLLAEEERRSFRKLSVFRRGFSRQSAEKVVGASAFLLSALVDKSLLRWTPPGRYEMHELLRQYGTKKLVEAAGETECVHNRHCSHYASFLQKQEARLKNGRQKEALEAISVEIDNIRAGWYWAVAHRREEDFEKYREGLFLIHNMQSWFQEGEAVFRHAATSLRKTIKTAADSNGQTPKMLGQVLARQGVFCASLGQYDQARSILQEGISIFQNPDFCRSSPLSITYLGAIAWALGEYEQARQLCRESLTITQEIGDRWKEGLTLEYLGMISISLGEYVEAKELAQRCLEIFREFGYRSGIAFSLNMLGIAARNLGEYTEAKQFCQESLVIAREIGDRWEEALSIEYLSMIAISMGEYVEARALAQRCLVIFREFDYSSGITFAKNLLGTAARNLGEYAEAKRLHEEVLQTCRELDYHLGIALAAYYLGHTTYLLGDYTEAERLLTESLSISKRLDYHRGITRSLSTLGSVAYAQGEYDEAQKYMYEALKMTQETYAAPMALDVLAGLANLLMAEGHPERAVELLTLSRSHAASEQETRDKANHLLTELASKLPDQVLVTAQSKGKAGKLEEVVAEILQEKATGSLALAC
jgi:predicted ATPase